MSMFVFSTPLFVPPFRNMMRWNLLCVATEYARVQAGRHIPCIMHGAYHRNLSLLLIRIFFEYAPREWRLRLLLICLPLVHLGNRLNTPVCRTHAWIIGLNRMHGNLSSDAEMRSTRNSVLMCVCDGSSCSHLVCECFFTCREHHHRLSIFRSMNSLR